MTSTTPPLNVTISVNATDASLFYELAAEYHRCPDTFRKRHSKTSDVVQKPNDDSDKPLSFYNYVSKHCSCGSCYWTFARASREPWRSDGTGRFVSCKYAPVEIPKSCPVSNFSGEGYIYDAKITLETAVKTQHFRHELSHLSTETSIGKEKLKQTILETKSAEHKVIIAADDAIRKRHKSLENEKIQLIVQVSKLENQRAVEETKHWDKIKKTAMAMLNPNDFLLNDQELREKIESVSCNTPFLFSKQALLDTLKLKQQGANRRYDNAEITLKHRPETVVSTSPKLLNWRNTVKVAK